MPRRREDGSGTVYDRNGTKWIAYRVGGERFHESTKQRDKRVAYSMLADTQRAIRSGTWLPPPLRGAAPAPESELTVREYLERWIAHRHADGVHGAADEARFLERFAIPALGAMELRAVERRHIKELVATIKFAKNLRTGAPLSPRSVLHAYRALATAFADATLDGLIPASPCTLRTRRGELPKKLDRDVDWRSSAVYTREEAERLISDDRIDLDRRVLYALLLLSGGRSNEVAALRWRDYDQSAVPLHRITIAAQTASATTRRETKTSRVKLVPVHPVLAAILAEWRMSGFELLFGRAPRPDDPIVPSRRGVERFRVKTYDTLVADLERIGVRRPPAARHAMRATFLTLAEASGCNMAIVMRITHAAPSTVVGGYIRTGWTELAAEVAKIRVERRRATNVYALPLASGYSGGYIDGPESKTALENQGRLELRELDLKRQRSRDSAPFSGLSGPEPPSLPLAPDSEDPESSRSPMHSVTHVTAARRGIELLRAAGHLEEADAIAALLDT